MPKITLEKLAVLSILLCLFCGEALYSNSAIPFPAERRLIDNICAAGGQASKRAEAFHLLLAIALSRKDLDTADVNRYVLALGLDYRSPASLESLRDPLVRAYAIARLPDFDPSESIVFLHGLLSADIPNDDGGQIRSAARIAYWESVLLVTAKTNQSKISQLERLLFERFDPASDSSVQTWAANKLCDLASASSLPLIRKSIAARDPFESGKQEVRFCEARVEVLSAPKRVDALSSVLRRPDVFPDFRLKRWAVGELLNLGSIRAEAELQGYDDRLRLQLPTTSQYLLWMDLHEQVAARERRRKSVQ